MRNLIWKYRVVLLVAVATAATAFASAAASAAPSPVVGHVYVNDNTTGTNTIAAFDRHADGTLTPVAGSPFAAGGAGTGSGLPSQGAIQVTRDGRYVLAVDAGSNQISVLGINADGSLRLVGGRPFSSGGAEPVSVAERDGLVYVANAGLGGSNYTGLRLNRAGHLRRLAHSTVTLPEGADPGDVLFNSSGSDLVGIEVGTSLIDSFRVGSNGLLTPAPGSPFAAQGPGPFGSEFRPTRPSQLFVSNAHGGTGNGTVSAFRVAGDGALSSIGTSPFADHQTAPCWVEISHDGRFLFAVNTGSDNVSRYRIAKNGRLVLLGSTAVSTQTGVGAVDARLSTDGRTLYVDESGVRSVAELAVSGGRLTRLGEVALPAGAVPAGIAVK